MHKLEKRRGWEVTMSSIIRLGPVWFLVFAGGTAMPQVVDGSRNPQVFSDREALGVLFTVVRSGQPGGWDLTTRHKYLMELGLTRLEAFRLIEAADAWFGRIHPLDAELRDVGRSAAGKGLGPHLRQRADELASRKLSLLEESLSSTRLSLGLDGAARLDQALLVIKRGMKAYVAGTPPKTLQRQSPVHH